MVSEIIIVGAGIAGLMAAHTLQRYGHTITILEAGAVAGGRLATAEIGPGFADSGAQFFTVRTAAFDTLVQQWIVDGLVFEWSKGWSDGSLHKVPPDGHPRYAVHGGMQQLATHLSATVDCHLNQPVAQIEVTQQGWQLMTAGGMVFPANALLLTPPVPQAVQLCKTGVLAIDEAVQTALGGMAYEPCLTGIFHVTGPFYLPPPGALQRFVAPIHWLADNQRKGISPETCTVTAQMNPTYSAQLWDEPDDAIMAELEESFMLYMGPRAKIQARQIIRWRYARPIDLYPEPYFAVDTAYPLAFAGDGFGSGRIEGAALSGMAAAEEIHRQL